MNPTGNGPKVEIKTTVDSQGSLKQIHDTVSAIKRSVDLTGGAIASYEKRVNSLIKGLESITRQGSNAGQTVRDLSLAGGGSTIAGRVRQSNARSVKSDMSQIQEVLVADIVNFQAGIYKNVARSVKSALITSLARQKQEMASIDAEIRAAQIDAQRARVGFATQLSGTRGNVRGTITQNANALGVGNLGSLKAEQAALDKLLSQEQAYKAQAAQVTAELRQQEQMMGSIARLSNSRLAPLRQEIEALQKQNAIERQNLEIMKAQHRGDQGGALKARLKQESLRLDQMALRGVKEESAEFQHQMALIKGLNLEQQRLNDSRKKSTVELREQARLQDSRNFAAGAGGNRQEVMQNNIIGARRVAMTPESRASLLGMQGNLLMNYGLLGGGVAAIGAMTAGVVQLDAKLRELQAIAGATNNEFEGLRAVVIKTSEDTKFSAVELAEASVMLAQVGQSVREIEDTLPVISSFAMAVGTDMKNAVDIVTTSLTVFNMNTDQTQRITNVLTEALNRSKLSMDQLVLGFQYSANIAADSGVTFEELTATLAGMSQAGIRSGSMLGTGLRQILISLASPTEEVTAMIAQLGLTMNDVDVKTQGLTGVLENLANAGISAGDAMGAFETRTAAALVAASNQVGFIRNVQEQFAYTTAAEQAAAVQSESFKNSVLELKNEFMSFMNDAARPVLLMLIDGAKTMKSFGDSIGPAIPLIKALGTALIVFAGATAIAGVVKLGVEFVKFSGILGGFATMLPRLSAAWNMFALSMTTAGTASSRAALGLAALNTAFPPLLLLAGVAAGIAAIHYAMRDATSASDDFTKAMDEQKTAYNEAKAAQDKYQQVLGQIDQTIARVKARADNMRDGSEELRIEILNGASAFNEYGAGIDATNVKMQAYIESLGAAKAAVIALAEEQAKEAARESAKAASTAASNFAQTFRPLRNVLDPRGIGGRAVATAVGSELLTAQEKRNVQAAFDALSVLSKQNPEDLDAGELSNFLTNTQVMINMLGKARTGGAVVNQLNDARFSAATLMGARSTNQQAQVSAAGLALLNNPDWASFRQRTSGMIAPLGSLNADMSAVSRANRNNPAEAFRQNERILGRYGATFREISANLEKIREDYDLENKTPAQQYAFNQIMNPVNDELVRIREVLINTQRANDQLAAENLQILRPLVEQAPSSEFNELMNRARSLGLTPTAANKPELLDWIDREISRRQNGVNVDTLLGRDSGMSVIRQSLREEQIRTGGAVATAERLPMAQRIRDRAKEFGLSDDLMRTIASIETGGTFDPRSQNPRSSAGGLFQFMDKDWAALGGGDKYNAELNMTRAMEEMTRRIAEMTENLGRRPEDWEMYLAWQQGVRGATSILTNPNANAVATRGRQNVLLNGGTEDMTNSQFAQVWRQKFAEHRVGSSSDSMRSLGEAAEAAAEEARKNLESVADGAKSIATTAKGLATRTLRNLGPETSDENALGAVEQIRLAVAEVEDQTTRYYRLKLQALIQFRDSMDAAGRLTPQQYQELNVQIADLQEAQANDMDRIQEETITTLKSMYEKLPQFSGSIGQLISRVGETLDGLTNIFEASAENIEIRYQEARDRIASDVDARAVATGRMSAAEASARAALRARDANNAGDRATPGALAYSTTRAATISSALDSSLGNTGMTLRDVDIARLTTERQKLLTISREDEDSYAKQAALVDAITANLAKANELRVEERDLLLEIDALHEAIGTNDMAFGERVKTIVAGWVEEQGTFKSLLTDTLNGIPTVLDATSGAFSTFFSDIMNGTATVGDAFKAMAGTILKAMMDVVASEAAKQMMRMVFNIGMSLFGGGGGQSPPADLAGLYREGGMIRAAGGYGPVRGRDSVNIKAMPGEYVLRKSAVDAIGADNLDIINAQGNRVNSSALSAKPVIVAPPKNQERPLEVYIVSPDQQPPPTKDQIIVMVQEDMINRGPVYKTTKAIQQGAI